MARRYRILIKNLPFLIYLKSIEQLTLFKEDYDYNYFLSLLKGLSERYFLEIHAYALLQKEIYFLVTPRNENSIIKFMQNIARMYTAYYNKRFKRSGTIWSGRYKASLVEAEEYLLDVMVFIESLPKDFMQYQYSSITENLLCKKVNLIFPHKIYSSLGKSKRERCQKYALLFQHKLKENSFHFIKENLEKQLIIGSHAFINNLEQAIGKTLRAKKRGRPKKREKKRNEMYKKLVVLDKVTHANLKLKPKQDLFYAKDLHYTPIMRNEIKDIADDLPIVFSGNENILLVALLSLGEENLTINEEGKWIYKYIPQYIQKYPFALAISNDKGEEKIVLIDEESPLFSKTQGEALFTQNGEVSKHLQNIINFLIVHDKQMKDIKNICSIINDSGILTDREISIQNGKEKKILVKGFKVVDRDKLNQLSDEILAEWVRNGVINLIELHLSSLKNIEKLFQLTIHKQK